MENKELEVKDFDIIIGDGSELVNADIPVRWCISKELMADLKEKEINHPHILFCTIDDRKREMSRQVFPLEDLMAYVRFERPGVNKLYAFIINNAEVHNNAPVKIYSTRKLSKVWTQKYSQNEFNRTIFENGKPDYKNSSWRVAYDYILNECMNEVDIPKELFGKEPPLWFLNIVNMWHDTVIQDQCHFRQRVLFTVFFKGWIVGVGAIIASFINLISALLMSGFGFKNTNWQPVIHPYRYTLFGDVWEDFNDDENYMYIKVPESWLDSGLFKLSIVCNPIVILILFLLSSLLGFGAISSLFTAMLFPVAVVLVVMACLAIGIGIYNTVQWLDTKNLNPFRTNIVSSVDNFIFTPIEYVVKKVDAYFDKREKALVAKMYNSEEAIYCPKKSDNLVASIYAIPAEKRTVKLRVLEIKNKFCKPMPKM